MMARSLTQCCGWLLMLIGDVAWANVASSGPVNFFPSAGCRSGILGFTEKCCGSEADIRSLALPAGQELLVFSDDWGRHPSSCQHLVRNLLDQYNVTWVNTIGTRTPRLNVATLRRGLG